MRRIAIVNEKGGVGKTSTAVHLSAALAELGHRTLLADCDAQGDASAVYLRDHESLPYSMADIFSGTGMPTTDLVRPTDYDDLFILPADDRLRAYDSTFGYEENDPRVHLLADAVSQLHDTIDIVIFDCPPRPHLTTFAALVAATDVLVPVQASRFSVRSLTRLTSAVAAVQQTLNPQLRICGYFLSLFEPRAATQLAVRDLLISNFGHEQVFKTVIPKLATYDTAINLGKPVTAHAPRSKATETLRAFAKELLQVHNEPHEQQKNAA